MADFTINNIGATVKGIDNGNGTYTVKTQGSKLGSTPKTEILTEEEVFEKFGEKANLKQDTFDRNVGGKLTDAANSFIDYSKNCSFVKYDPVLNGLELMQAYMEGDKEKAMEIAQQNARNLFDLRNPYLYL